MNDLVVGLIAGIVCALAGASMPWVVSRLPEPPAVPEPEEGADLTPAQQIVLDEGPKQPYDEMARSRGFAPTVVAASGICGALLGGALGWEWTLLLVLPLAPIGAALALVDLRSRLLPSRLVLPATAAAIVFGLVAWPLTGSSDDLVRGLIGMVAARSIFWVLWFIRSAGMGFGDVRLSALLGFVLAYLGWEEYAVGLYSPFLIFAIPGLVLAIVRRDRSLLKKARPFGPFLLAGAVIGTVLGEPVMGSLISG
jgi:leader peptidase (prepilin peptidase) / N-methyltransferase